MSTKILSTALITAATAVGYGEKGQETVSTIEPYPAQPTPTQNACTTLPELTLAPSAEVAGPGPSDPGNTYTIRNRLKTIRKDGLPTIGVTQTPAAGEEITHFIGAEADSHIEKSFKSGGYVHLHISSVTAAGNVAISGAICEPPAN